MTETRKRIKELKAALPRARERIAAVAVLLAMSVTMMATVSYAWYTMSFAPEVSKISTTIVGNGNLEIALSGPEGLEPGRSQAGDSFAATGQSTVNANLTWGNLLNLSDAYGIENIVLRPAKFNSGSKFFLSSVSYDADGRVENDNFTDFAFTSWSVTDQEYDEYDFVVSGSDYYGVRAISSVGYKEGGKTPLQRRLEKAQSLIAESTRAYDDIMKNEDYIDTLRDIVQKYLYVEMYRVMKNHPDYSFLAGLIKNKANDKLSKDQVAAMAGIYSELNDAVVKLGDALVYLANVHQYMKFGENKYTDFTINTLTSATPQMLTEKGVEISPSVITAYATLQELVSTDYGIMQGLNNRAMDGETIHLCDQIDDAGVVTVPSEILPVVNNLIDIETVKIDNRQGSAYTVKTLTSSLGTAATFIGTLDSGDAVLVIAQNGNLKNYESISGARMDDGNNDYDGVALKNLDLVIKSGITGYMTTNARTNEYSNAVTETMNRDANLTANMVAKQTYGMVIDLWLRTNAEDAILALDGLVSSTTEYVPDTLVLSGESTARDAYIYNRPSPIGFGEDAYTPEKVNAYREVAKDDAGNETVYYYDANNRSILYLEELVTVEVKDENGNPVYKTDENGNPVLDKDGKPVVETTLEVQRKLDADGNPTPLNDSNLGKEVIRKMREVVTVTGFNGANRIYDDVYVDTTHGELSATQGSGSCFIFYTSSPEEADQTKELLKFLKIAFVGANSQEPLGSAYFDVEHIFSNSGKHIVPLVVSKNDALAYEDANGNICYGITEMEKNVPTRISAVIYLEGEGLDNTMAMSDSITSGSLNLQFTTTEDLKAWKDSALHMQTVRLNAQLSKNTYHYDDADKNVTLSAQIEGFGTSEDTLVQAIFQRKINDYQGTRMAPITLRNTSGNAWAADFTFNMPGTYVLDSLWVNGEEYALPTTLTLNVTGFEVTSVSFCNVETERLAMTAENYVIRPVSVKFNSAWIPDSVSARIVSEGGTYISVPLTYNASSGEWEGMARFTESGTYTIQYLYLEGADENGEDYELYYELDERYRNSLIAKLGLTVRVKLNDSWQNQSFIYESGEIKTVSITAEILTNTGEAMKGLTDVELFFHKSGSSVDADGLAAELEWDGTYYKGNFNVDKEGQFAFDRMVVGSNVIKVATRAPIINARNISPIRFDNATGSSAEGLIVSGDDGTPYYVATITNANATNSMKVVFIGPDNKEYTVDHAVEKRQGNNFYFPVPATANGRAGVWKVKEIQVDGVYDINGYYYGTDGTAEARADYYTIKPTVKDAEGKDIPYQFTVLEKFEIAVIGATLGNQTDTQFMSEQTIAGIKVKITDPIMLDMLANNQASIGSMSLRLDYQQGTSSNYGSYRVTSGTVANTNFTLTMVRDETVTDEVVYVIRDTDKKATLAGCYDGTLTITVSGKTFTYEYGKFTQLDDVLKVYSAKPTVKIRDVSTNASTDRYYTSTNPTTQDGMLTGSYNERVGDFYAVVYMYFKENSNRHDEAVTIKYPTVSLSLSGIPTNHSGVTMVFNNASNSSSACTFTFAAGATTASSSTNAGNRIGGGTDGTIGAWYPETYPVLYPAGKQTVRTITVTYGGATYAVTLSDAVTINNPLCPPYADFTIDNDSYTGATPPRVFATPQADGTFKITLPSAGDITTSWDQAVKDSQTGTFVEKSHDTTTYYEVWNDDCDGAMYQEYKKHVVVSEADRTVTSFTRSWKITGWRVENTTYSFGETITITEAQTVSAVLTHTDGAKTISEYLVTKTTKWYDRGNDTAGAPQAGFKNVTEDPDNGNKDNWVGENNANSQENETLKK